MQAHSLSLSSLQAFQSLCHGAAVDSGWWNSLAWRDPDARKHFVAGKLALVHSEVSEALEAFRKDLMDDHLPERKGMEVEMADAVIRILDLAGALHLDVFGAAMEKIRYNATRADHLPANRALPGGKSL